MTTVSTTSPNSNQDGGNIASNQVPAPQPREARQTVSARNPGTVRPILPSIKFSKQLNSIVKKSATKPEMVRGVSVLLKAAGCTALWIVTKDGETHSQPISLLGDDAALLQVMGNTHEKIIPLVESNQSLVSLEPPSLAGSILLGAPIVSGQTVTDIVIGLYPTTNRTPVPLDWAFEVTCNAVSNWQMTQFVQSSRHQLASLSSFVNMAAAMNRTDNQLEASITLVNELKNATRTGHVALMLKQGKRAPLKLVAMSGVEFFDRNASMTQTIESTILGLDEEPLFWSNNSEDSATDQAELRVNLRNFCNLFDAAGCALLPLRNSADELFGWLLLSLDSDQCGNEQTKRHFFQITNMVAGQMETVLKSQRTITRIWLDNTSRFLKKNVFRKIALILAIAGVVLCLPFAYKIPCDCELQLTSRRFVAAPYEGLLEKTLVASGDIVTEGQTLARMDARQLRMELSGLTANIESERKKRDSALAKGAVAESQIARSEMNRLDSEIAIITDRLSDTEIRSPVAGVIVSGDMDKVEGAPMEMGQNLFEVGPLEQMLVEVHIPESEIQHAQPGMNVTFEFDAFPFETFEGEIERIHPRAEVLDTESVFVAEVSLENASGQLRPGLKGRARIQGERHPLGWNLFHGAFEKARQWLIW